MSLLKEIKDLNANPDVARWYKSLDPAYQSKYDSLINDAANAASQIDSIGEKQYTMSAEGERVEGKTLQEYGQLVNEILTLSTAVRTMANPNNQTPRNSKMLGVLQDRYLGIDSSFGSASKRTGTFANKIKDHIRKDSLKKHGADLQNRFVTAIQSNGQNLDVDGDGIADIVQAAAYDMTMGRGWSEKDGKFSRTGGTDTYHRIQSGELSNILRDPDGNSLLTAGSASPKEQVFERRPVEFIAKGGEKGPNNIRYHYDINNRNFFSQEKGSALKTPDALPTGGDLGSSSIITPQIHTYQYLTGNDAKVGFEDRSLYQQEMVTDEFGQPVNLAAGQNDPTDITLGDAALEVGIGLGTGTTAAALLRARQVAKKMKTDPEKLFKQVLDADQSGNLTRNTLQGAIDSGVNPDLGLNQTFDDTGAIDLDSRIEEIDDNPLRRNIDIPPGADSPNPLYSLEGGGKDGMSTTADRQTAWKDTWDSVRQEKKLNDIRATNPDLLNVREEYADRLRNQPPSNRPVMVAENLEDVQKQLGIASPVKANAPLLPKQTLNFDSLEAAMEASDDITPGVVADYLRDHQVDPAKMKIDLEEANRKKPGAFKRLLTVLPILAAIPATADTLTDVTASTPAPGEDPIFDALGSSKVRDLGAGTAEALIDATSPDPTGLGDEAVKKGTGLYDRLRTSEALKLADQLRPEIQHQIGKDQANTLLEALLVDRAGALRNQKRMEQLRRARFVDDVVGGDSASSFVEIPVGSLDERLGGRYLKDMAHQLAPFGVGSFDFQGEPVPGAQLSGSYNLILDRSNDADAALLAQPQIIDYLRKKKRDADAAIAEQEMMMRQPQQKPDFSGENNPFYWDSDTFSKPF